jgi:hypothetical protein
MKFPLGAMSLGDILDRGLKLLLGRFPLFFTISLLVQLPVIILQMLVPAFQTGGGSGGALIIVAIALLSLLILTPISQAVILYVVAQEYIDRPATLGQAFSYALSRFGSLLGSVILAGLITFLGFLAFCIPGIYLGVLYSFVSQVVVLENLSGMNALNRSKQLVSGHWGRVFGVIFLIQIVIAVIGNLITFALGKVLPFQEIVPVAGGGPFQYVVTYTSYPNYHINIGVVALVNVVLSAYLAICITLLYLDLRIRKEGFDLEMAARGQTVAPEGGPAA